VKAKQAKASDGPRGKEEPQKESELFFAAALFCENKITISTPHFY